MSKPYENQAIVDMPKLQDENTFECLLGTVQYLSHFLPKLLDEAKSLRQMTENEIMFTWQQQKEEAFTHIKEPANIKSSS